MAGHGTFYWNELMTRDVARAKEFYAKTLGWDFESMPGDPSGYQIAKVGDTMVAGIMGMPPGSFEGVPEHWFSYVEIDDLDKRLALLTEAGGTIVRPPFEVPEVGKIAIVSIPGGAVQGWMVPVARG